MQKDSNNRNLPELLLEVRSCTVCAASLPFAPRPVLQLGSKARIVIIGQAPGRKVQQSGIPWDDQSGRTLRSWLGLSEEHFYNPEKVALMPMGFCYPGSTSSGDKPPRPQCAPLWHDRLLEFLPANHLKIIIGAHAQKRYAPENVSLLTEAVAQWDELLPDRIVLPHPSPRNRRFLTKNPWFVNDTLPALRDRIDTLQNEANS